MTQSNTAPFSLPQAEIHFNIFVGRASFSIVDNSSSMPLFNLSAFLQNSRQLTARCISLRFLTTAATRIKKPAEATPHIRTRRLWTEEESELLLKLVEENGPRWTYISRFFNNRSAVKCLNRWKLLTRKDLHGPWSKEELDKLREVTRGKQFQDLNWEEIQKQLPAPRPIPLIKQTWMHSINPQIKHGKWSPQEIKQFDDLIKVYGLNNWDAVAEGIGTRTRRQCIERWRWQHRQDIHKGKVGSYFSFDGRKINWRKFSR